MSKNVLRLSDYSRRTPRSNSPATVVVPFGPRPQQSNQSFETLRISIVRERTEVSLEISRSRA